jgi:multiple sugar transport system ATP-binding protein
MVYVTHDQVEAMSLADRIAVMDGGLLQQYGTPAEIFDRPANTFVANFMGSPSMNLIPCRLEEDGGEPRLHIEGAGALRLTGDGLRAAARAAKRPRVILGVRPEAVGIEMGEGDGLTFEVDLLEPIGPRTIVHLRAGALEVLAVKDKRFPGRLRSQVRAVFPERHCHLFDAESGASLGRGAA